MIPKFNNYLLLFLILICYTTAVSFIFSPHASAGTVALTLSSTPGLFDTWKIIMGIANSFVILILIVVAFAEILHIQIDTYTVKKVLPSIIMAVVAANFSFILCRIMVDFSSVAGTNFDNHISKAGDLINTTNMWPGWNKDKPGLSFINALGSVLFTLALLIAYVILGFLFFVRSYVIYFLVVVSPIAVMAMVLPVTKKFFDQWLGQFLRWVFLPVPSLALIWLMSVFMTELPNTPLLKMAFAATCLYGAIVLPFQLGGPIMQKWGDFGKKAFGAAATVTGAKSWAQHQQGRLYNWGRSHPVGQFFEGRAASGRFKIQQETDIGTKLGENADKKVYGVAKRDMERYNAARPRDAAGDIIHDKRSANNDVQLKRINSKLRKWSAEEGAGWDGKDPGAVVTELTRLGFIRGGRLVNRSTQFDIGASKPADYHEGTYLLNMLQKQRTNAATRLTATAAIRDMLGVPSARNAGDSDDQYVYGQTLAPADQTRMNEFNSGEPGTGYPATSAVGTAVTGGQPINRGGEIEEIGDNPLKVVIVEDYSKRVEAGMQHIDRHDHELGQIAGALSTGSISADDIHNKSAAELMKQDNSLGSADAGKIAEALAMMRSVPEEHLGSLANNGDITKGLADIRQSLTETVRENAIAHTTGNVIAGHLEGREGTINSVTSDSKIMEQLAGSLNQLHQSIGDLSERPLVDPKGLTDVLKGAMAGLVPPGGNGGNTSMASLLGGTDEQMKKRFADTMGKAVAAHMASQQAKSRTPTP